MPPCRKIPSTKAVHGVKLVAENAFWPKKMQTWIRGMVEDTNYILQTS